MRRNWGSKSTNVRHGRKGGSKEEKKLTKTNRKTYGKPEEAIPKNTKDSRGSGGEEIKVGEELGWERGRKE